jgi:O-antigen/teichoic acid export membrane protein
MSAWVIFGPLWSAATNAYAQGDINWIRKSYKKMMLIFSVISVCFFMMFAVSLFVFEIWVGNKVSISWQFSLVVMLQNAVMTYGALICSYINGIGKIRLQLYGYWICVVLYLVLCIWLGRKYGVAGIVNLVSLLLAGLYLLLTVQYFKIVSGKSSGIWLK